MGKGYPLLFTYTGSFNVPKLDFPSFNDTNMRVWLHKVHRYFQFNPIEYYQKVLFASLHF